MLGPDPIEKSQKNLFQGIQSELALLETSKSSELRSYERSFLRNLPKKIHASSKATLLKKIKTSKIILVGDFHSFRQSQKAFLRLINEAASLKKSIGIECVLQEHQKAVDEYLSRRITLDELREKIDFESNWPFSWKNYREIFEIARAQSLKIYALNIREKSRMSLRERDKAAATKLASEIARNPKQAIFVLYGELHLGAAHLPANLSKALKSTAITVIHQNIPTIYWRAPKDAKGNRREVIRLSSNEFCILNAVPWVKLRSYLDWMEGNPHEEDWTESELDTTASVLEYAKILRKTFNLKKEIRNDYEILESSRMHGLLGRQFKKFSPTEKSIFTHSITFQRTGFIPSKNLLLVPQVSTNALTECATIVAWRSQTAIKASNLTSAFLIIQFFTGYLGSKILNPKRKCNDTSDLKDFLRKNPQNTNRKRDKIKHRIFLRALSELAPYLPESLPSGANKLSKMEEIEACRIAGYILAERFFQTLTSSSAIRQINKIFTSSPSSARWLKLNLQEISKIIAKKEIGPSRKRDRF